LIIFPPEKQEMCWSSPAPTFDAFAFGSCWCPYASCTILAVRDLTRIDVHLTQSATEPIRNKNLEARKLWYAGISLYFSLERFAGELAISKWTLKNNMSTTVVCRQAAVIKIFVCGHKLSGVLAASGKP